MSLELATTPSGVGTFLPQQPVVSLRSTTG